MAERKIGAIFQFGVDQASQKQAEAAITGLKNFAEKALGAIGVAFSVSGVNKIVEQYSQINDRISYAVRGIMDAAEAQNLVSQAARDSRVSYAEMAEQAAKLTSGNSKLFDIESASKFAKLMNQIGQSAGMDDSRVQNMNSYMSRVMSLGTLNQETFKQLKTQAPEVLKVIADGLGTNVEQLGEMAKQGTLTAEKIKNAVFLQEGAISAAYAKTSGNVSEGIQTIRNAWGKALASADEQLGITAKLYDWCVKIADKIEPFFNRVIPKVQTFVNKMGGIENVLKLIAAFAGASHLPKILDFIKKIGSATGILSAKTFALVGLLLMVEDFMAFMRNDGTETIIGGILGDNADEARDKIQGVLDKFDTLKEWFSENVDPEDVFIVAVFIAIAKAIGDIAAHSGTISALKGLLGFGSAGGAATGAGAAAGVGAGASVLSYLAIIAFIVRSFDSLYGTKERSKETHEAQTNAAVTDSNQWAHFFNNITQKLFGTKEWTDNRWLNENLLPPGQYERSTNIMADKYSALFANAASASEYEALLNEVGSYEDFLSGIYKNSQRPHTVNLTVNQTNRFENADAASGARAAHGAMFEFEEEINRVAANV